MKKSFVFSIFACLLILGCSSVKISFKEKSGFKIPDNSKSLSPQITYKEISDSTHGCISGVIVEKNNEGVPFANVVLSDGENGTQTNKAGKFEICNINTGFYDLCVMRAGYFTVYIENLIVENGQSAIIDTFLLEEMSVEIEKPIIYLYPETIMDIQIVLDYDGKILHSYPKYENGWRIKAHPNGTLYDSNDKEYYALFWEGKPNNNLAIHDGFIVPGNEVSDFLENALKILGLSRREANEFIVYWLPKLENNPFNLIHFSTSEYEQIAKLNINPSPDTLIRIMMVVKRLNNPIEIKEQDISLLKKERKGFTVVEWGGCLLK
jgi:CarboxypepD_reg-like domain